jgi:hypothetical protein
VLPTAQLITLLLYAYLNAPACCRDNRDHNLSKRGPGPAANSAMQLPVTVLNAGTKREQGKKAQMGNINAAKVRTSIRAQRACAHVLKPYTALL